MAQLSEILPVITSAAELNLPPAVLRVLEQLFTGYWPTESCCIVTAQPGAGMMGLPSKMKVSVSRTHSSHIPR